MKNNKMKTLFSVKYNSTWDNENKPLQFSEGNIDRPLSIKWKMQEIDYEIVSDQVNFISRIFAFQDFIMVCYSKNSKGHSFPDNLVIYNLKKEIIKTLTPPIPINWDKISPVYSIGEIKEIDGEKYIAIYIDTDNYFSREQGVIGFMEIRWLNLTTFEYHPTEHTLIKDYGK